MHYKPSSLPNEDVSAADGGDWPEAIASEPQGRPPMQRHAQPVAGWWDILM